MKTSIFSRTMLTIFLATLAFAHVRADSDDETQPAADQGPPAAPGKPGSRRGSTVSSGNSKDDLRTGLIELGVIGAALLAAEADVVPLLTYEAVLGAVVYGIALNKRPQIANSLAGHVAFATGVLLACKWSSRLLRYAVPTYVFAAFYPRLGGVRATAMLAKVPGVFSRLSGFTLSSEQRRAFFASIATWLRK